MDYREKKRIRKQAVRAYPTATLPSCAKCGAPPGRYPRHHPDIEHQPEWVIILCDKCHEATDRALGKWGRGAPPPKKHERRVIQPFDALPEPTDPTAPPLLVLCGAPSSGKTTLVRELGFDLLEQAGALPLGQVDDWLATSQTRPSAVEHVGVSEIVHHACIVHLQATGRPGLLAVCYVRPNTLHQRIMTGPNEPKDQTRHEHSAWADRVGWVLRQLYPPARSTWLSCEAPPHVGALHVKRALDTLAQRVPALPGNGGATAAAEPRPE